MSEIDSKLKEILASILNLEMDEIDETTSPETVSEWDSLNHLNICTAICQEYGISMTTDQMIEIQSAADLARLVAENAG